MTTALKIPGKDSYLVFLLIPITLKWRHFEVKLPYGVFVMLELLNRSAQVTIKVTIFTDIVYDNNGGWQKTLNLLHASSCRLLHFVTCYISQNKDVNKLE